MVQERVGLFRRWVASRPEKVIVLIGHSTHIKYLTGKRLANAQLHTQYI